jgi:hypothetical protein
MESTSSSSSTGAGVVNNIWENLLRPKPELNFPSSFGLSPCQPVQSFANLWENKLKHEHSDPVVAEEDMDWEPNILEVYSPYYLCVFNFLYPLYIFLR